MQESFLLMDKDILNKVFLTLMKVMNSIIKNAGSNNYILSHMGKEKLKKNNKLPETIKYNGGYEKLISVYKLG